MLLLYIVEWFVRSLVDFADPSSSMVLLIVEVKRHVLGCQFPSSLTSLMFSIMVFLLA